jgi:hypothetical protein
MEVNNTIKLLYYSYLSTGENPMELLYAFISLVSNDESAHRRYLEFLDKYRRSD